MAEDIWTTEEDIRAEREQIQRWRQDEDTFWTYLRRYAANRRRNEQSARRYQYEFEMLHTIGWTRLSGPERTRYLRLRNKLIPEAQMRQASWTLEVDRIVKAIYAIRDKIAIEEERLHRKRVKPIEEQWIADEAITGYDIYYRFADKKYVVRDEKKALVRVETKICMELTASIRTSEGRDTPVVVEITCTTYVKEMDLSALIQAEKKVEQGLMEWLKDQGWGSLIHAFEKTGVSYSGKTIIEERGWYTWSVPDLPKVHVVVEKKKPRARTYDGEFKVEE